MKYTIPEKNWITLKAEIRTADIHGKGLFAKEAIKQGEKVVIWGGQNYTNKVGDEEAKKNGKLIMQWDDDLFSFEDRGDDDTYFINHSCDSNLWMDGAFTLIAKKDIEKDEEITADYALWEGTEEYLSKWECKCGETCCRKRITGKDYILKDVQERYAGHFSPLVSKKIATKK